MAPFLLAAARFLAAAVLGYLLIALGQTLCLEVWLDGGVEHGAAPTILAAGIAGTVASGLAGGFLAALIGGARPLSHAAAVLIPLGLDTAYVVTRALGDDPLWFALGGSLTLMAATLAGGFVRARTRRSGPQASRATA